VLALAGCGAEGEQSQPAASTPATEPSTVATTLTAPPIVLVSSAGKQVAVPGSSCVTSVDRSSGQTHGVCRDSGVVHPKEVTVLPPGASVTIVLGNAQIDGRASVVVRPLGCERTEIEQVEVGGGRPWLLDLPPGAYQADVFTRFKADDGSTGDTSGSLGIVIDPNAQPAIEPGPPRRSNC
jgi:hypothetical protein